MCNSRHNNTTALVVSGCDLPRAQNARIDDGDALDLEFGLVLASVFSPNPLLFRAVGCAFGTNSRRERMRERAKSGGVSATFWAAGRGALESVAGRNERDRRDARSRRVEESAVLSERCVGGRGGEEESRIGVEHTDGVVYVGIGRIAIDFERPEQTDDG